MVIFLVKVLMIYRVQTYDQTIDIDCGTIIHEKWKLSAVYT